MRVLLTGAAGWLGRHLKGRLVARRYAVVGLDIAPSPWTDVVGTVADCQSARNIDPRSASKTDPSFTLPGG